MSAAPDRVNPPGPRCRQSLGQDPIPYRHRTRPAGDADRSKPLRRVIAAHMIEDTTRNAGIL